MAVLSSELPQLGSKAIPFNLPDSISGKIQHFEKIFSGKVTVLMFICNHCPYVKYVLKEIISLANDYIPKGARFAAISSNDAVKYPEDNPERMKELALEHHFPFPYLYDESQEIARAYYAVCTPDFYVYNNDRLLAYHGRMDGASPGNSVQNDGNEIRKALDEILAGKAVSKRQIPSIGCSIKWK